MNRIRRFWRWLWRKPQPWTVDSDQSFDEFGGVPSIEDPRLPPPPYDKLAMITFTRRGIERVFPREAHSPLLLIERHLRVNSFVYEILGVHANEKTVTLDLSPVPLPFSVPLQGQPLPPGCEELGIKGMIEHPDGRVEVQWQDKP